MTDPRFLVTNIPVRTIKDCTFKRSDHASVSDLKIEFHRPQSFEISSAMLKVRHNKLDAFQDFLHVAPNILGKHYEKHRKTFERFKERGVNTLDPERIHRLIYLEERMRISIEGLRQDPPTADSLALCELGAIDFLLGKFKSNPAWEEFREELSSPSTFAHHLICLIYIYEKRLRGIEANFNASSKRASSESDIALFTAYKDRIDVEVKAPIPLWRLDGVEIDAAKIVERAWKKSKAQRRAETAVLVIGGLHLSGKKLDQLEEAARALLERKKNPSMLMIEICSFSITVHNPKNQEPLVLGPDSKVVPGHKFRRAKNPYYEGIVKIIESDKEIKGLSVVPNVTELTVTGDEGAS